MNIIPLNKLVVIRIGRMMYKHANHLLPPAINELYIETYDVHNYPTRQKHLPYVSKSNINIYFKSFGNTSARVWNAMQSKFEVNVSIFIFKISSKKLFTRTFT